LKNVLYSTAKTKDQFMDRVVGFFMKSKDKYTVGELFDNGVKVYDDLIEKAIQGVQEQQGPAGNTDSAEADECKQQMCSFSITDDKAYKKWLIKNHPDKFPDEDEKRKRNDIMLKVSGCKDKKMYCT
jgi:hypothetical protein